MIQSGHRSWRRLALTLVGVCLVAGASSGQSSSPAADTEPAGWEQLNLSRTTLAGVTVWYEKALEPNLPIFERQLKTFLAKREEMAGILGKRDAIVTDINRILGADDADAQKQAEALTKLARTFSELQVTFYLVGMTTTKAFLRTGGRLPGFSYDAETDMATYNPEIHVPQGAKPPERFDLCIPIAPDKPFGEYIAIVFDMFGEILGAGMLDVAIHEVTEMTLLKRARPTDPYWRWFSDGFANAITHRLVGKYMGRAAAEQFAATFDPAQSEDLREEINLRYWMLGNFCVLVVNIPVPAEARVLHARYRYATSEARRLVDKHGIECVTAILENICAKQSRTSDDLLEAIREVTGEDMERRLRRYQSFQEPQEGIHAYSEAFNAAAKQKDYEQVYVNLMRVMELRSDVFSMNNLLNFKNAALLLLKMDHEKAADQAMQNALDLFSRNADGKGRQAALEMQVVYAIECQRPQKAEEAAAELLAADPNHVLSLAVKMLVELRAGHLTEAQGLARKIQALAEQSSPPYKLAANVLAIDPNRPVKYKEATQK